MSNPVFTRVRSVVRTKKDFEPPQKLHIAARPKHIPEGITLEEEQKVAKNPYRANRPLRQRVSGVFNNDAGV